MDPLPPAVFNLMEGHTDVVDVVLGAAPSSHIDENKFSDENDDSNYESFPLSDADDEEEEPSVIVTRVVTRKLLPTSTTTNTATNKQNGDGHHGSHVQHLCDADEEEDGEEQSVVVMRVIMRKLPPTSSTTTSSMKHTGGHGVHKCWELLSDKKGQHLVSQTQCRSCRMMVKHQKKSEKVKAHLNSCSEFCRSIADLPSSNIPSWVTIQGRASTKNALKNAKRKLESSFPRGLLHTSTASIQASNSSIASSPMLTQFSTPRTASRTIGNSSIKEQRTMRDFVLPAMAAADHTAFHNTLATHIYMTGTSFVRVEEQHLLLALQKLRPDVSLPSRKDLSGKLLNYAHQQVKEKVDVWLDRDLFACLTSDAWSNVKNESIINYRRGFSHI